MDKEVKRLRLRIGIFGRRNVGKSSIFNKLARHEAAIVSPIPGTTTDPVRKSMEHHFLGPILLIDTAGLDDHGELGMKRIEKTARIIKSIDIGILVIDGNKLEIFDIEMLEQLSRNRIPVILVVNKTDLSSGGRKNLGEMDLPVVFTSAVTGEGIRELMDVLKDSTPSFWVEKRPIIRDLFREKEFVILVTSPVLNMPGARIPVTYNRIIRDALDNNGGCAVVPADRITRGFSALKSPPALVIMESCIVDRYVESIPENIPVTTTSLIFARLYEKLQVYRNNLENISKNEELHKALFIHSYPHKVDITSKIEEVENTIVSSISKNLKLDVMDFKEFKGVDSDYTFILIDGEEEITNKVAAEKIGDIYDGSIPVVSSDVLLSVCNKKYKRLKDFIISQLVIDGV